MNFTVVWNPSALDELADIWTEVTDRNAVTWASEEIDFSAGTRRTPANPGRAGSEWLTHCRSGSGTK